MWQLLNCEVILKHFNVCLKKTFLLGEYFEEYQCNVSTANKVPYLVLSPPFGLMLCSLLAIVILLF